MTDRRKPLDPSYEAMMDAMGVDLDAEPYPDFFDPTKTSESTSETQAVVTLAALATLPRWVAWRTEQRKTDLTKVPYSPVSGRKAEADDPATWGTRVQAATFTAAQLKPLGGGIGIELGDLGDGRHLCGIDLDTCLDEAGAFTPWALAVIERFLSYTEISPSGTGAKLFFLILSADLEQLAPMLSPKLAKLFKQSAGKHPPSIELYCGHRYFATTDNRLPDVTDEIRVVSASDLRWLLEVAGPALKGTSATENATELKRVHQGNQGNSQQPSPAAHSQSPIEMEKLRDKIKTLSESHRNLSKRWAGDWTGLKDQSRSGKAFSLAREHKDPWGLATVGG